MARSRAPTSPDTLEITPRPRTMLPYSLPPQLSGLSLCLALKSARPVTSMLRSLSIALKASRLPPPKSVMPYLQTNTAQIEPPALHRRTPEVGTRHRARKRKQRVGRPVLGADHALQLRLEGVERLAESDEHESRPGCVRPSHHAPHHDAFRPKAPLPPSLHLRRTGGG